MADCRVIANLCTPPSAQECMAALDSPSYFYPCDESRRSTSTFTPNTKPLAVGRGFKFILNTSLITSRPVVYLCIYFVSHSRFPNRGELPYIVREFSPIKDLLLARYEEEG